MKSAELFRERLPGGTVPVLPASAPFSAEQRAWLNGFLAGLLFDQGAAAAEESDPSGTRSKSLLLGYGSQSGSAHGWAKKLQQEAVTRGYRCELRELNAIAATDLIVAERLVIVTSTWGEGDPPDNATGFWSVLLDAACPRLESLAFGVLGFGDRNYSEFCGAARKFDERLAALGARRIVPRGECDLDYEATARVWSESLWVALIAGGDRGGNRGDDRRVPPTRGVATGTESPGVEGAVAGAEMTEGYGRSRPFPARLKSNRRLNRVGSSKDTRHFEIVLEGSGLDYEPGDALGVVPMNCPALVEELLAVLGFSGDESVAGPGLSSRSIHDVLLRDVVITQVTVALAREMGARGANPEFGALLEPSRQSDLEHWLLGRDLVDILRSSGGTVFTPAEFLAPLRRLSSRLYSISSSPRAHPGEVHLTVASVRFEAHGRSRKGVCSCFLADRVLPMETPVPVFIQRSQGFRLPTDPSRSVIMIGPGTGIAPFRAFIEERRITGAGGRNWLFFGDQRRASDFLYEEELLAWQGDGTLHRLDLAFSRDQSEKVYVQTRMQEQAAELWKWLEEGAHLYVCGDAKRMAKDVDAALHDLIMAAGGKTREQAVAYVDGLKSAKRYQRDVY